MKCKLFLLALTLTLLTAQLKAQAVFSGNPKASLKMDVVAKADVAYLWIWTSSDESQMIDGAVALFTFFDGSRLEVINDVVSQKGSEETRVLNGHAKRFYSKSRLKLSPKEVELLQHGIKSIELRMKPYSYYYEWEEDELGQLLYNRYLISKENVMFKLKKKKK